MSAREQGMIRGRDVQISRLNTKVITFQRKMESKDLAISILCKELNEALDMVYGRTKAPDLTAERILQDTLSDLGKHNQKLYS